MSSSGSEQEKGFGSDANKSSNSSSPLGHSAAGSDQDDASSVVMHKSAELGGSGSLKGSMDESHETPGRPGDSVHQYADAYVRMMNDADSGRRVPDAVVTPMPDMLGSQHDDWPKSSQLEMSSAAAQPALRASNRTSPSQSMLSSSPSSGSSSAPMHLAPPTGFAPVGNWRTSAAPSSSASRGEVPSSSSGSSDTLLGQPLGRQASSSKAGRARSSASGQLNAHSSSSDYQESLSDEEEEEDYDYPPRTRRARYAEPGGRNRTSGGHFAAPLHSNVASSSEHPSRSSAQRHSRKNSTASALSNGSDPAQRNLLMRSSAMPSGAHHLQSNNINRLTSSHPGNYSPLQNSQNILNTRSTLHYIRRRLHALRALSILNLLFVSTISLAPFTIISTTLSASQSTKNACLYPSPPLNDAYFQHDMTSYLVVSGLWLCAAWLASIMSIASSFMFYWRRFMRWTLAASVSMCFITVVVMTWTIVLVAFAHEKENWMDCKGEIGLSPDNGTLRSNSIFFLVSVCVYWMLVFLKSVFLAQLDRFIMSKPRHCCWPLECCIPVLYDRKGPFSIPSDRRPPSSPRMLDSMTDLDDIEQGGVTISRASGLRDENRGNRNNPSRKPQPPSQAEQHEQQDLSRILSALQGIQSTVQTLAVKVQAIEDKESTTDFSDPFAYGRKF